MDDVDDEVDAIVDTLATEFPAHERSTVATMVRAAFDRTAGSPLITYRLAVSERVARAQLGRGAARAADGMAR